MYKIAAYCYMISERRMRALFSKVIVLFVFLTLPVLAPGLQAQEQYDYDELYILINVRGVGTGEISSVIMGDDIFLPVTDLFDFLRIRNIPTPGLDSISGFFISQEHPYLIDRTRNMIIFEGRDYKLRDGDLLRTETNLYLNTTYLGEIFGLNCKFNFRSLSVVLESERELPIIREMKQEELRRNIGRLKGEFIADTTIGRSYPGFHFGMADWSVISTQELGGKSDARFNLALGSVVAGGELTASLNYNTSEPFTEKLQHYRWRYVDNDRNSWKQILAGKINTYATSTIYEPVIGAQITNTPTTFRKSYGSYTISDKTEPGWIVELYVNNVLVDYVKADASGFYTFEVPLVYGTSNVKIKFYGPWGEERTKEQNINIPFIFIPEKTFEYTASAGVVEDTSASLFGRASMGYGLSKRITVGGGVEYLSSVGSTPVMPYLKTSVRLASSILLSVEYTYGVRTKANLSYRMPSNIQLDLNYVLYDKGQKAIKYNYREERKLMLSVPLKMGGFIAYNRLSVNQFILPTTQYTSAEWMFSSPVFGINTNLTTYALFVGTRAPNIYSNLSFSFRLPARINLMPQAQYSYTSNRILSAKLRLEKTVMSNGFFNISYERNFRNDLRIGEIGFRWDFSFAQTGVSSRHSNGLTTLVEYARGSVVTDKKSSFTGARRYMNVGKGGVSIIPFLDVNGNGKRDQGEKKLTGLNLHASSGRIERCERDSTIRILGLEAYTTCYIELDPYSFDNIAWKLDNVTISVVVDPNNLKLIEVPVKVMGEATGMIYLKDGGEQRPLSRVIVNFYSEGKRFIGRTLSESDGYFSYLGFIPGSYTATLDSAQLVRLKMSGTPVSHSFTIAEDSYGDIVDGLDFTLVRVVSADTVAQVTTDTTVIRQIIKQDTAVMVIHEISKEVVTTEVGKYAIQVGAFKRKSNAEALRKKLAAEIDKNVELINEDGFYKVRVTGFESREELEKYIPVLKKYGITEMWIVNTVAVKQDVVVTEKADTIKKVISVIETEIVPRATVGEFGIQVGAYRDKRWATLMRNRTRELTDRDVSITFEDGFYKVRISGIRTAEEMEDMMPMLFANGYKDVWLLPFNEKIEMPYNAETIRQLFKVELAPLANSAPTVALQVGAFFKKRDALKAAKKISQGTGRKTEVAKQWDYYTVFVTGFYTREETHKYYPEIVMIGYPEIYLVENYIAK